MRLRQPPSSVDETAPDVIDTLPALIDRASTCLINARTSAEVLEARNHAKAAFHYAKLVKARNESQADCLRLIKRAELRMVYEVDAGQVSGEVATADGTTHHRPSQEGVQSPDTLPATFTELGVDRRRVSEWRELRDAGGLAIIDEVIDEALMEGRAPTDAHIQWAAKQALNRASNAEKKARPVVVTAGEYNCIVIDPPWPASFANVGKNSLAYASKAKPINQVGLEYPIMDEEELDVFNLPSADDCHLFLWTTQKFIPMAFRLLDVWSFRYVCTFVWHKSGGFQPCKLPQYNCEFALYARKGTPEFVTTKAFPTCFNGARREHSRKPDEFYEMVRRVTSGPRIDIFSREAREGFDQYGNEIDRFEEDAE